MGQDDQDRQSQDPAEVTAVEIFETLKTQDMRTERRIFWKELSIISAAAALVAVYLVALLLRLGTLPVHLWLAR